MMMCPMLPWRFPVRSTQELATIINKIERYEAMDLSKTAVFAADNTMECRIQITVMVSSLSFLLNGKLREHTSTN